MYCNCTHCQRRDCVSSSSSSLSLPSSSSHVCMMCACVCVQETLQKLEEQCKALRIENDELIATAGRALSHWKKGMAKYQRALQFAMTYGLLDDPATPFHK